jgi:hypothetical protein
MRTGGKRKCDLAGAAVSFVRTVGTNITRDPYGGDAIQERRDRDSKMCHGRGGNNFSIHFNKRFCETCQTFKPRGKGLAFKGWKCQECSK